jgi:predicted outer membrane repeat protein
MLARKRQRLSLTTALVTLLTVLVIPTGGAFAADVGPIDCVTPGETLAEAITAANPNDTIIIDDNASCDGNFTANKSLTIRSQTATGATLDGLDVDGAPVLSVGGGATVTLQDLTITKGLNSAGSGGGIFVIAGATVNVVSSTVTLNSAANGGGIHSQGTVNISSSSVTSPIPQSPTTRRPTPVVASTTSPVGTLLSPIPLSPTTTRQRRVASSTTTVPTPAAPQPSPDRPSRGTALPTRPASAVAASTTSALRPT